MMGSNINAGWERIISFLKVLDYVLLFLSKATSKGNRKPEIVICRSKRYIKEKETTRNFLDRDYHHHH